MPSKTAVQSKIYKHKCIAQIWIEASTKLAPQIEDMKLQESSYSKLQTAVMDIHANLKLAKLNCKFES